jgi:hypothetical protein
MKALCLLAALCAASPALAAVECNTLPNPGDYRIRFSTEKSDYGLTRLHQDWIEKKTGKVSRTTGTVFTFSASQTKIAIRTTASTREGQFHPSYLELNAASNAQTLIGDVKWWSFRVKEGDLLPRWHQGGTDHISCIVD